MPPPAAAVDTADPGYGQRWVRDYFDEQKAAITAQREIFDAARTAFMKAAHQAADAELPATPRRRRVILVRQRLG